MIIDSRARGRRMAEISVLIVEDSLYSADLNIREIKKSGISICRHKVVSGKLSMQNALKEGKWDLIISDNSMPNFNALAALEIRNSEGSKIPFIIVSEDILRKDIEEAYKDGCTAFVSKEELQILRGVVRDVFGQDDS
jgi:CheY-like chemotaxis protein